MDKSFKKDFSQMLQSGSSLSNSKKLNPLELKKQNIRITGKDVMEACKEGNNLEQIAERFNVSRVSAGKLIERLLKKGEDITIGQFISSERESEIEDAINMIQSSSIKKLVEYFKGKIPEEEIRLVRGSMIARFKDETF